MIATLRGKPIQQRGDAAVIEAGGVGYEVFMTTHDLAVLPKDEVFVHVYHHVREETNSLYGFLEEDGRRLFEQLLGVSGVGPKVALSVLSAARPARLRDAISSGDVELLKGVAGIGKKTAERLVVELRNKLGGSGTGSVASSDEAYRALLGLGFSASQAAEALSRVPHDVAGEENRLRAALKEMSR